MMKTTLWAALITGTIAAAAPAAATEHRVRIEHHGGAVDAVYRADVAVSHRQVGAATPGGRASTLRCLWSAGLTVERQAQHPGGSIMTRSISRDAVVEGSRAGWCSGQRAQIAREVALRTDRVRQEMMAIAEEDHSVLRAELDQMHANRAAG
ncbi:hypothetical protein [Sphingomonas metalli]|nr:hypothetical protein [Sphingomonas metalli]